MEENEKFFENQVCLFFNKIEGKGGDISSFVMFLITPIRANEEKANTPFFEKWEKSPYLKMSICIKITIEQKSHIHPPQYGYLGLFLTFSDLI
jgi:hypothetical protein